MKSFFFPLRPFAAAAAAIGQSGNLVWGICRFPRPAESWRSVPSRRYDSQGNYVGPLPHHKALRGVALVGWVGGGFVGGLGVGLPRRGV
jgi:hypothetical protein